MDFRENLPFQLIQIDSIDFVDLAESIDLHLFLIISQNQIKIKSEVLKGAVLFFFQLSGAMEAHMQRNKLDSKKLSAMLDRWILLCINKQMEETDRKKKEILWHKELALRRMKRVWLKSLEPRVEEPGMKELAEIIEIEDEPPKKKAPEIIEVE